MVRHRHAGKPRCGPFGLRTLRSWNARRSCYTWVVFYEDLKPNPTAEGIAMSDAAKRAMPEFIALIETWAQEDSDYDRETLPLLLAALEGTRSGKWCRDS